MYALDIMFDVFRLYYNWLFRCMQLQHLKSFRTAIIIFRVSKKGNILKKAALARALQCSTFTRLLNCFVVRKILSCICTAL